MMDMIDCMIEGKEAFYKRLSNEYGEVLCDFPIYANNRLEYVTSHSCGQIQPLIITSVRPFGENYYKVKVRAAKGIDYKKPPKPAYFSLALTHEEIRDVWMYISENPGKSYLEIKKHTKASSNARVHAIMKFLHDSGYITQRGGKTARSYTVNMPLVRGTVTKLNR